MNTKTTMKVTLTPADVEELVKRHLIQTLGIKAEDIESVKLSVDYKWSGYGAGETQTHFCSGADATVKVDLDNFISKSEP